MGMLHGCGCRLLDVEEAMRSQLELIGVMVAIWLAIEMLDWKATALKWREECQKAWRDNTKLAGDVHRLTVAVAKRSEKGTAGE